MRRNKSRKGIAFIFVLIIIVILSVLGAAVVSRSISERNIVNRFTNATRAFWLAEAGIQTGIWELRYGAGAWTGWSGSGNVRTRQVTLTGLGDYDVEVDFNQMLIAATGYFPSRSAADRRERQLEISITGSAPFSFSAFGLSSVSIGKDSVIDSYDSSLGNYGGSNVSANGDIGTNGTVADVIALGKNTTLNGDASTGPSGTVDLDSGAQITGTTTHNNNLTLSSVTVPSLTWSDISDITGSQTLASGNYRLGSIIIEKNGILTIGGPANIYVTSTADAIKIKKDSDIVVNNGQVNFYVNGNIEIKKEGTINNQNLPSDLVLYGTSNCKSISIAKENNFYAAIYAPDADISISKEGAFYGSVIGKTITIKKESQIHFDQALRRLAGASGFSFQNWQETQNPY